MPENPECIVEDAALFGKVQHGGDWLMAYLVARNVEKHTGGGGPRVEVPGPSKVSARQFADLSGVSRSTIGDWLDAWNWAADQRLTYTLNDVEEELPLSEFLVPGDETGEWSLTTEQLAALNAKHDWKQVRKNWLAQKELERKGVKQTRETLDEVIREVGFTETEAGELVDAEVSLDDDELQPAEGDYDITSDPAFVAGESDDDVHEEAGHHRPDGSARARSRMDDAPPARGGVTATVADWRASGIPRQAASRRLGTIEREVQELLKFINDQDDFEPDAIRSFQGNIDAIRGHLTSIEQLLINELAEQVSE